MKIHHDCFVNVITTSLSVVHFFRRPLPYFTASSQIFALLRDCWLKQTAK